jgi:predicted Zn finger-like uncharacterized protein
MIVQCEKCESRFNLDESLLKEGGSKVRCSLCRHVFLAYPPQGAGSAGLREEGEEVQETVILDSPPDLDEAQAGDGDPGGPADQAVPEGEGEAVDDREPEPGRARDREGEVVPGLEGIKAVSPEGLLDTDEPEHDMDQAFDRASRIEEEVSDEDSGKKARSGPRPVVEMRMPGAAAEKGRRSRLLPVLLGIILLAGAAYASLYFFSPGTLHTLLPFHGPPAEKTQTDPGVRRLSFERVKGSFVDTEDGKQRFVIQGAVVNNYPEPRSFIRVSASILDDQGRRVMSRSVYAGNPFSRGDLVGRSMEYFEERGNRRRGEDNRNTAVPTGGKVPFTVVFQDLPENISEFTVEGVSSAPAGVNQP